MVLYRTKDILQYTARALAAVFIFSIFFDIYLIAHSLLLHKPATLYQGILASTTAAIGALSLGIGRLLPKRRDQINLREIVENLNKSRLSLVREEIGAALFHYHNRPIDIKLTLLKTSSVTPPANLMKFMSINELFLNVPYGRMSAIGPPGAGKSLLVQQFVLEMCSDQHKEDSCVPVIIPAQNWDPRASSLDHWLVRQVSYLLDIEKAIVWSMLNADLILPIFDGLDEMDQVLEEPSGASEFIKLLNGWHRKFILTCRTDTWIFLESAGYILEDACNVRLEPLTSRQVAEYLELRGRPNARGANAHNLIKKLSGNFSSTLSTPFDLALVGSLLSRNGSIDKLMQRISQNMTTGEIENELLAAFVDARVQWYPKRINSNRKQILRSGGPRKPRYYAVEDAFSWLRSLASFLQETGGAEIFGVKMPTTTINIERLWPIAGKRAPRIVDCILTVLLWAPVLTLLGIQMHMDGTAPVVTFSIIASLAVLPISSMWANRVWVHPSKIVLQRLLQPKRLLRLALGLSLAVVIIGIGSPGILMSFAAYYGIGFALVFALGMATAVRDSISLSALLAVGATIGLIGMVLTRVAVVPTGNPVLSLASGAAGGAVSLVIGVKVGIYVAGRHGGGGLDTLPAGLPTPLARLYGDFQAGLIAAVLSAIIGAVIGLTSRWPVDSTWEILLLSILAGIAAGPGLVAATWRRYIAMLICAHGRLPVRLTAFLRWAHASGLLRTAGRSYEFRHRRLLDWLTR